MAGLLIKNLPPELHARLKDEAERHRRSMTQQALVILEEALGLRPWPEPPAPFRGRFPLTQDWLDRARRDGRA
jgi:hypothetical protein